MLDKSQKRHFNRSVIKFGWIVLAFCFAAIFSVCNSEKNSRPGKGQGVVEFLCVDQFGDPIENVSIVIDQGSAESDAQGKSFLQVSLKSPVLVAPVKARKDGYIFLSPDSVMIEKDLTRHYVLNLFRGYDLRFSAIKKESSGDSPYPDIEISMNGTFLGTTDATGNFQYYLYDYQTRPIRFEAKATNKRVLKEERLYSDRFDYQIDFVFKEIINVEPAQFKYRFIIRSVLLTDDKKEYLGGVNIYLDNKKIGQTDIDGRFEYELYDITGIEKYFEAELVSLKQKQKWQPLLDKNKPTYFMEFSFKRETRPEPAHVRLSWIFVPNYKPPTMALERVTYYFMINGVKYTIRAPEKYLIGDIVHQLFNQLNSLRETIPVKKVGPSGKEDYVQWVFLVKQNDQLKVINPRRSFQENKIQSGDTILIKELPSR